MLTLTPRQRQILRRLAVGDLLWEVPDSPYFSQYNEETGKTLRVHVDRINQLAELDLIAKVTAEQKLDCWHLTTHGRQLASSLIERNKKRRRNTAVSSAG